jgi:hypothetical protein
VGCRRVRAGEPCRGAGVASACGRDLGRSRRHDQPGRIGIVGQACDADVPGQRGAARRTRSECLVDRRAAGRAADHGAIVSRRGRWMACGVRDAGSAMRRVDCRFESRPVVPNPAHRIPHPERCPSPRWLLY